MAAAPAPSRPPATTPRMGAAPPVMTQATRAKAAPPPPPPPETPIVAKEKGSADLEELDFLFDADELSRFQARQRQQLTDELIDARGLVFNACDHFGGLLRLLPHDSYCGLQARER